MGVATRRALSNTFSACEGLRDGERWGEALRK